MAAKFYAVTDIRHGERKEDGSAEGKYTRTEFKAGDEVKGLDKETMKTLWQAGALERRGDDEETTKEGEGAEQKPTEGEAEQKPPTTPKSTGSSTSTAKATGAKAGS